MSDAVDIINNTSAQIPYDPMRPVLIDGTPITLVDTNDANINGVLDAYDKWCIRTNYFTALVKYHAASVKGRIYIDHPHAVPFILGDIKTTYSFENPSPPTPVKMLKYNSHVAASGGKIKAIVPADTVPTEHSKLFIHNPLEVAAEKARYLTSLNYIFGKADWAADATEEAAGDGLHYRKLIADRGAKASLKDRTAAASKFEAIRTRGVTGELTIATLDSHLREYKLLKIGQQETPKDLTEAMMINKIALKDPTVGEQYELKATLTPPTDLKSATALLKSILLGRQRDHEIREIEGGLAVPPPGNAFVAAGGGNGGNGSGDAAERANAAAALARTGNSEDMATLIASAVAAAVDKLVDPKKLKGKGPGGGVHVPRNPDNSVARWVSGMQACRYCGANHLHRDCKSDKAKEAAARKAASERGDGDNAFKR